ncbi:MAG: primosomal protein N' [Candidatus Omnitrophica bacterium]|nr:primosomal protein N' [Candidatus Omnitrophota bacterium]
MLYAEIVLGLPIEGPFDYYVPKNLENRIAVGKRVFVPFRKQRMVGYVIRIKNFSSIRNIKSILAVIDEMPVLDIKSLKLSKSISRYYYCSWGEAIDLVLPTLLRKGRKIELKIISRFTHSKREEGKILLIQDLTGNERWQIYIEKIKEKLIQQKAIIFLVPEASQIEDVIKKLSENFKEEIVVFHSKQKDSLNLLAWQKVKNGEARIAIGTRMAVFLPFSNLGLIIMDEENNPSYKEEQSPYYHSRNVAIMRVKLEKIELVLSDISPSLESLYLVRKRKINYLLLKREDFPSLVIVDTKREVYPKKGGILFSYPLSEFLRQSLQNKDKVLIFLNKKGFSTFIFCPHCRKVLKCPRCDINLVYYFKEKILSCRYCNYRILPTKICPDCNSSYIRYSGVGTEKLESKLSLFYPEARILRYECGRKLTLENIDFLVSTEAVFRTKINSINSIVVLSVDNILNRIDFRAAEDTFYILLKLLTLQPKRLLIQTEISNHYCFEAIKNKDINIFYNKEIALRKQLKLPPIKHLALIKLKGINVERVKAKAELLFKKLKKTNKHKDIRVISCFSHTPLRLRDNYIWQIMLSADSPERLNFFLKKNLRKINFANIVINVEID